MKEFGIAVVFAVSGIILLTASSGDGLCFGTPPPLGNSAACSNKTDFQAFLCRLRCLFCHPGMLEQPFGCIAQGNGTCLCIQRESGGGGNSTTTVRPNTTSTELPDNSTEPSGRDGGRTAPPDVDPIPKKID